VQLLNQRKPSSTVQSSSGFNKYPSCNDDIIIVDGAPITGLSQPQHQPQTAPLEQERMPQHQQHTSHMGQLVQSKPSSTVQSSNDSSVVTYPHQQQQQMFVDCDQLHQQPMKCRRIKDSYGMGDYISTGEIIAFDDNEKQSIEVLKKRKKCIPAQKIRIPASVHTQKRRASKPAIQSTDPNRVLKREKRKLYLSRMCPEELEHFYSVLPFFFKFINKEKQYLFLGNGQNPKRWI
jgi:hypothetical protein